MNRALVIFVLLTIGAAGAFLPPAPGMTAAGALASDDRAPGSTADFVLENMAGEQVPFRSFIGRKPLVVVLWATWCPVCRSEVPALNRLNGNPAFQVLAVNLGESRGKVTSFVASNHVGYPVVFDHGWKSAAAFRVMGIPFCIIFDREGRVLYRGSTLPENIESLVRR